MKEERANVIRNKVRLFLIVAVVFFNAMLGLTPNVANADGGMNLDGYCKSHGYAGVKLFSANPAAYGWKCVDNSGNGHDMDLYAVCAWQYGGGTPVASDLNNANSWQCTGTPAQAQPTNPPPPVQNNSGGNNSGGSSGNSSSGGSNSGNTSTNNACSHQAVQQGATGQINPGDSNHLRNGPGVSNMILGDIPAGSQFTVISSSVCADGHLWLKVNYDGVVGWTAQGDSNGDWVTQVSSSPIQFSYLAAPCIASSSAQQLASISSNVRFCMESVLGAYDKTVITTSEIDKLTNLAAISNDVAQCELALADAFENAQPVGDGLVVPVPKSDFADNCYPVGSDILDIFNKIHP